MSLRSTLPTLDAGLTRLSLWWDGRPPRERMLLGVLGALLAAVVLVYGVIKPLQSARAEALSDIRTYETLTARIRAAGTLGAQTAPRRQGPPIQLVSGAAGNFGLTVVPQPVPGGVRATIANGNYDSVMGWLADLAASSDLRVKRLNLQRLPTPGHVSASVEFAQ